MTKMKEFFKCLLLLVGLLYTNLIFSQQGTIISIDSLAARDAKILTSKFNLTPVQEIELVKASKVFHLEVKAVKNLTDTTIRKIKVQELQKRYNKSVKKILTSEQFSSYKELQKARRAKIKERTMTKKVKVKEVRDNTL